MKHALTLLAALLVLSPPGLRAQQNPVWVLPDVSAPGLQRVVFASKTAGQPVSCYVFTPEAYDRQKEQRFPVLYWLHGSGGGSPMAAGQHARRYGAAMQAGKIPPMIIVYPNGLPMGMWCDWKDGSVKLETLFLSELMPQIDRNFRTLASREGRIIDGFSMGGYGAARLGFRHPQFFGAVSLMGAGPLQPDFSDAPRAGPRQREEVFATVYGSDMAYFLAQSPWQIVEQNAAKLRSQLLIRQVIGDKDETLRFNRDFHQRLESLRIPHAYHQLPGIPHNPNLVLDALGEENWAFYRRALDGDGGSRPAAPFLEKVEVFPPGLNGVARYRIPGVVVTPKGTVLAYCEARKNSSSDWGEIEVHLRRSTDGGRTWQPSRHIAHQAARIEGNPHKKDAVGAREQTVNNPVAIVDRDTGAIEFLYCVNYARCFSLRSTDDGVTWSAPVEITATFEPFRRKYDWKVIATGPGHGIQLKSGRLVVPIWLAYGQEGDHKPSAAATIYSDDHGKTWQAGDLCLPNEGDYGNPNETMLTELSDGRVMLVTRSVSPASRKLVTTSRDGATGWTKPVFHDQLWEPVCMASIVAHPKGVLLFSNPHTLGLDKAGQPVPAGRGKRQNLAIKLSRDDGKTWPVNKTLEAGPSAYSDLAVLPDGTVLCLFERADSIDCARFNLEWVTAP